MSEEVYLAAGLRSPIGTFGGSLAPLRATQVATTVAKAVLDQSGFKPEDIELVVGGMVLQDMTESNPARIISERVGIPHEVPAFTINMQCCSSMAALIQAAQAVRAGEVDVAMATGSESMSSAPHMVPGSRWGHRLGHGEFIDTLKECTLAGSRMWDDPWYMIDVAENHAKVDGVSREEMDAYAIVSHNRSLDAIEGGRLKDEIVPIEVPQRRGGVKVFDTDENPRPNMTPESLAKLNPVKDGGVITAGNAASINDGSAVAIVCNKKGLAKLNAEPLAKILMPGTAMAGCDPHFMGYSCNEALNKALKNADKKLSDLDLIECNEGFGVQLVACREAGGWDSDRLNVDGGSVGLGHPVGMSGLRIAIHLARALKQRGGKLGGATIPAGSGLGAAVLLEVA